MTSCHGIGKQSKSMPVRPDGYAGCQLRAVLVGARTINTEGGLLPFSAGANRSCRDVGSRHSCSFETTILAAPPQGGSEPILTDAALWTNVGFAGTLRMPLAFHAFIRFLEPVRSPHALHSWTGLPRRQRYAKLPRAKPMMHRSARSIPAIRP